MFSCNIRYLPEPGPIKYRDITQIHQLAISSTIIRMGGPINKEGNAMNQIELVVDILSRNLEMTKMYLADLSEQDMFVRPVPGANHAAWQFGHLTVAETGMLKSVKPEAAAPLA